MAPVAPIRSRYEADLNFIQFRQIEDLGYHRQYNIPYNRTTSGSRLEYSDGSCLIDSKAKKPSIVELGRQVDEMEIWLDAATALFVFLPHSGFGRHVLNCHQWSHIGMLRQRATRFASRSFLGPK